MPEGENTNLQEIEALFKAGVHIGYSKSRRHPKMQEYIFRTRNNIEIFNLEQTLVKLNEAEEFIKSLGRGGKLVLWVGTKPQAALHIKEIGQRLNLPYVSRRWLGGTLTNFKVISGRIKYWDGLENEKEKGEFEKYTKKEKVRKEAEIKKLDFGFGGLKNFRNLPDALVIIDPKEENTAAREALKKEIPAVALLNVDCDPTGISYPIPGNDNSTSAVAAVLRRLADAYETGLKNK